ncbi:hypothetical protein Mal4_54250 [Maioricimonas rarisocia]|uniref:Glycosyl transferases group 1 n=1 Tax=Maioricimonas rarisocia TaxID=2528026 RepID=A0A517ZEY8_9PLAN|nr:glycosyltransferase family 4 protein [Maioricimonas rarisocia]QDU41060.1 hypothetical protein Mal4_54250 [Maioricimonas rarisocia]
MNVALLHYHLNPGGVTRVMANHLLALDLACPAGERIRVAILFDGQKQGWPDDVDAQLQNVDVTYLPVQELAYDVDDRPDPDALAAALTQAFADADFPAGETIIHAHNHALGKNASLPGALARLAEQGTPLLLQVHDFAEDFRPRNYGHLRAALGSEGLSVRLYPQGTQVHYAALNRRDQDALRTLGVAEDRLHFLPNPVPPLPERPPREEARAALERAFGIGADQPYVLYPVRGIRRKNLGEFVLLSQVLQRQQPDVFFGLTLAPLNPHERRFYDRWAEVVRQHNLPCHLETGGEGGLTFAQNLAAADRIVTTSVAEGFGMVYLEAWLADRLLVGRNLPEITADFDASGLKLDQLYDHLFVPIDWIGRDAYARALGEAWTTLCSVYGRPEPSREQLDAAVEGHLQGESIDFGDLNEAQQESVIERLAGDPAASDQLFELNPSLGSFTEEPKEIVAANREVVEREYALTPSGERLISIYSDVLGSERQARLTGPDDGDRLLELFLDGRRIRLIRD